MHSISLHYNNVDNVFLLTDKVNVSQSISCETVFPHTVLLPIGKLKPP